jgi:ribulose-5-phosphate 4-epimerase/fuculose-1-phosphate aldolase/putative sterol carrier protein
MEEKELRHEIIALGRKLYDYRLAVAKGGNLSARLHRETILITATAVSLGALGEDDLIPVDLSNEESRANRRLSTEFPLHCEVYRNFAGVHRVIHCHPPLTNAYFSAHDEVDSLTYETRLFLGKVPVVEQPAPSIVNPQPVIEALKLNNIVAIRHHGVVALGETFPSALHLVEALEEAVRMAAVARLLGREGLTAFEQVLKEDLSRPAGPEPGYEMFSPSHIEAIVERVNQDELIAEKGKALGLTVELAVRLQEEGKAYRLCFQEGRITKVERDDQAPFVISAPNAVWRQVFLGNVDPFVATSQGKMQLKGELGKLARWYVPFSRLFELFREVRIF